MLISPIMDKLRALGWEGMLKALEEQLNTPKAQELGFEEKMGLMVNRKAIHRKNRRLKNRLAKATLRYDACLEDMDYRQRRGRNKSLIMALASCRWIAEHHNLLISGPTGVGKNSFSPTPWGTRLVWKATRSPTRGCQFSCAK
ncbi:hypothetical protein DFAR_2110002 [Desulfarculales bacterium]